MSRHRIVRSMNYSDEYDGYEDVYGHSVEDDYSMSPTDAAFIYDRSSRQQAQISAFLEPEGITEEDEQDGHINEGQSDEALRRDSLSSLRNHLSDIDEARLRSCLDEVRNVIGDNFPESVVVDTILKSEFDVTRALDELLKTPQQNIEAAVPKQQRISINTLPNKKQDKNTGTSKPLATIADSKCKVEMSPAPAVVSSPIVKLSTALTNPAGIKKGFQVPSANKTSTNTNLEIGSKVERPQTPKSNSNSRRNSPDPERKNNSAAGDNDNKSTAFRNSKKAEEEWKKLRSNNKEHLHMVTIGHVDAGKSTLMGHLLYRLGHVNQKTMHKYEQESKKIGKQSFVYAWILDETGEERTRGITMDVGQSHLETKTKTVTLLDAPGHKDFIPNMITGAAQADVALLVVDATRGEFETGFESGGQTREHALLVRSLGVSQLCVAVNKLDTVNWSEDRFNEIVSKMKNFLKQAGFRDADVTFVPCSGLTGQNLVDAPTEKPLCEWYNGPSLIDVIDKFNCPERPISKPLRLSVNDVFKGTGSGFSVSGRVETGMIQQGDKVLVQPLNETAIVKALQIEETPSQTGFAGDYVSVTISNFDQQNMSVGCILSHPSDPVPVSNKFEARIVVFNIKVPITSGYPVVLHQQSLVEPAFISKLSAQLHKNTGQVVKKKPKCLLKNSTALVVIETGRPICVELYRDIKELGRFMLRVSGVTIAAGLITKII